MKNLRIISFILLCFVQWFIPAKMILDCEDKLETGSEYRMHISPITPHQTEEGQYVNVHYADLVFIVDSTADWQRRQQVYISLAKDDNGLAFVTDVNTKRPESDIDYLKAMIRRVRKEDDKKHLYFIIPGNSYYLEPDFLASLRPTNILQDNMAEQSLVAILAIKNGKGLIKDILHDKVEK